MEARIISGILRLFALLPLAWLHRLGRLIGKLFILIPNRERRIAEINLALCFPELSETDRVQLRNRSLEEAGRTLTEMAAVWYWPIERVMGLIQKVSGKECLSRKPEQGLIVLSPHLGCWEIAGLYVASQEAITSLYRPPRKQVLEPIIKRARERSGAELVPTDGAGVKRLYRALQSGGATGILPDQQPNSSKGAVFAPFFGVPALTMLLVNRLVAKTGARVVFCFAQRLPAGRGYHIHFLPAPAGIDSPDPRIAAGALNQGVESCVRQLPEQYQWSYKRFKAQPEGRSSPYDRN